MSEKKTDVKMLRPVTSALVLLGLCTSVTLGFKRTNIKFNKNTGGYRDVVVVVSEDLSAASCPQILDNIKVGVRNLILATLSLEFVIDEMFPMTRCLSGINDEKRTPIIFKELKYVALSD